MPLSSRDLVRQFAQIHGLMEDQLNEFLSMFQMGMRGGQEWRPPTDVFETDDMTIIRMEIASVPKEHLNIEVHGSTLLISGKRVDTWRERRRMFHQMEIQYGTFSRQIVLSDSHAVNEAEAYYQDGLLEIRIPRVRKPEVLRRSIRVSVRESV